MGWDAQGPTSVPAGNQAAAAGVQFEPFPAQALSAVTAPSTQLQTSVLIGVLPGATLNGILFRTAAAAAGSLPTTARFAALDITGKVLVRSANVNALANWTLGPNGIPFSAPYQVPAGTTALYATFVVNGTWGTTQPTILNAGTQPASTMVAFGTAAPPSFVVAAVADLPAVGASVVISGTAAVRGYYMAFY